MTEVLSQGNCGPEKSPTKEECEKLPGYDGIYSATGTKSEGWNTWTVPHGCIQYGNDIWFNEEETTYTCGSNSLNCVCLKMRRGTSTFDGCAGGCTFLKSCDGLLMLRDSNFDGTAISDHSCIPLTVCDTLSQYQTKSPLKEPGYSYYVQDRECAPLTECSELEYEEIAPTEFTDRKCAPLIVCDPNDPISPTFEENPVKRDPSNLRNVEQRKCKPLTQCVGQFVKTPATATSDRVCDNGPRYCKEGEFIKRGPLKGCSQKWDFTTSTWVKDNINHACEEKICTEYVDQDGTCVPNEPTKDAAKDGPWKCNICASQHHYTVEPLCQKLTTCTGKFMGILANINGRSTQDHSCIDVTECKFMEYEVSAPVKKYDTIDNGKKCDGNRSLISYASSKEVCKEVCNKNKDCFGISFEGGKECYTYDRCDSFIEDTIPEYTRVSDGDCQSVRRERVHDWDDCANAATFFGTSGDNFNVNNSSRPYGCYFFPSNGKVYRGTNQNGTGGTQARQLICKRTDTTNIHLQTGSMSVDRSCNKISKCINKNVLKEVSIDGSALHDRVCIDATKCNEIRNKGIKIVKAEFGKNEHTAYVGEHTDGNGKFEDYRPFFQKEMKDVTDKVKVECDGKDTCTFTIDPKWNEDNNDDKAFMVFYTCGNENDSQPCTNTSIRKLRHDDGRNLFPDNRKYTEVTPSIRQEIEASEEYQSRRTMYQKMWENDTLKDLMFLRGKPRNENFGCKYKYIAHKDSGTITSVIKPGDSEVTYKIPLTKTGGAASKSITINCGVDITEDYRGQFINIKATKGTTANTECPEKCKEHQCFQQLSINGTDILCNNDVSGIDCSKCEMKNVFPSILSDNKCKLFTNCVRGSEFTGQIIGTINGDGTDFQDRNCEKAVKPNDECRNSLSCGYAGSIADNAQDTKFNTMCMNLTGPTLGQHQKEMEDRIALLTPYIESQKKERDKYPSTSSNYTYYDDAVKERQVEKDALDKKLAKSKDDVNYKVCRPSQPQKDIVESIVMACPSCIAKYHDDKRVFNYKANGEVDVSTGTNSIPWHERTTYYEKTSSGVKRKDDFYVKSSLKDKISLSRFLFDVRDDGVRIRSTINDMIEDTIECLPDDSDDTTHKLAQNLGCPEGFPYRGNDVTGKTLSTGNYNGKFCYRNQMCAKQGCVDRMKQESDKILNYLQSSESGNTQWKTDEHTRISNQELCGLVGKIEKEALPSYSGKQSTTKSEKTCGTTKKICKGWWTSTCHNAGDSVKTDLYKLGASNGGDMLSPNKTWQGVEDCKNFALKNNAPIFWNDSSQNLCLLYGETSGGWADSVSYQVKSYNTCTAYYYKRCLSYGGKWIEESDGGPWECHMPTESHECPPGMSVQEESDQYCRYHETLVGYDSTEYTEFAKRYEGVSKQFITRNDCETYATQNGMNYVGTYYWNANPSGCFQERDANVYFNESATKSEPTGACGHSNYPCIVKNKKFVYFKKNGKRDDNSSECESMTLQECQKLPNYEKELESWSSPYGCYRKNSNSKIYFNMKQSGASCGQNGKDCVCKDTTEAIKEKIQKTKFIETNVKTSNIGCITTDGDYDLCDPLPNEGTNEGVHYKKYDAVEWCKPPDENHIDNFQSSVPKSDRLCPSTHPWLKSWGVRNKCYKNPQCSTSNECLQAAGGSTSEFCDAIDVQADCSCKGTGNEGSCGMHASDHYWCRTKDQNNVCADSEIHGDRNWSTCLPRDGCPATHPYRTTLDKHIPDYNVCFSEKTCNDNDDKCKYDNYERIVSKICKSPENKYYKINETTGKPLGKASTIKRTSGSCDRSPTKEECEKLPGYDGIYHPDGWNPWTVSHGCIQYLNEIWFNEKQTSNSCGSNALDCVCFDGPMVSDWDEGTEYLSKGILSESQCKEECDSDSNCEGFDSNPGIYCTLYRYCSDLTDGETTGTLYQQNSSYTMVSDTKPSNWLPEKLTNHYIFTNEKSCEDIPTPEGGTYKPIASSTICNLAREQFLEDVGGVPYEDIDQAHKSEDGILNTPPYRNYSMLTINTGHLPNGCLFVEQGGSGTGDYADFEGWLFNENVNAKTNPITFTAADSIPNISFPSNCSPGVKCAIGMLCQK